MISDKIVESCRQESAILGIEKGGFERPAGKPPGGLEPLAITRATWRFVALSYLAVLPCPSARDWEEAPPTGAAMLPAGRDNFSGP
jgi:hypothetical protein